MSTTQFENEGWVVWISLCQLVHGKAWHWAQIHIEKDEWLVGGSISNEVITKVVPFDGKQIVEVPWKKTQVTGKEFDWGARQCKETARTKRRHDEMASEDVDADTSSTRRKLGRGNMVSRPQTGKRRNAEQWSTESTNPRLRLQVQPSHDRR